MFKFSIRVLAIVLALLVPVSGMGQRRTWGRASQIPPDDQEQRLSVNGVMRSYILHVPKPASKDDLRPLVVVFHGGGGHARNMPNFTGFDPLADAQGFVVAYPDSFNKSWSDTRGLSPADDVGFIRALISQLLHSAHVDPKRVYATGISNGGFFSQRLACDLTDKIAAVASVAATMPEPLVPLCKPSRPISVMFVHGTKDPLVPIDGGPVARNRGRCVSLAAALSFWRGWNQTSSTPASTDLPDEAHDGTRVHHAVYGSGKQGTEVVVYTIDGGGHTWPGGSQYLPVLIIGKASQNLDATRAIWEFFQRHSIP